MRYIGGQNGSTWSFFRFILFHAKSSLIEHGGLSISMKMQPASKDETKVDDETKRAAGCILFSARPHIFHLDKIG